MKSKPANVANQGTTQTSAQSQDKGNQPLPARQIPLSEAPVTVQREMLQMQSFSRPEKSASEASAPVKTPSKSRKGPLMGLAACILLIIGGTSYYFWPKSKVVRADLITHVVKPEKLQITVLERGTLEALDNKDVICQVRAGSRGSSSGGATTIKWVIDDGSHVKLGDLLVELDDSALQEQLKTQRAPHQG